jgi:hypothetical protein
MNSERSPSITDFKEFEGRDHFVIVQENWQEGAGTVSA